MSGMPGRLPWMTIVYGGQQWYVHDGGVHVQPQGEEPRPVALEELPLPVARVLLAARDEAA
jgi:hypothetical protein